MNTEWPSKDPNEVLDFSIDWSAQLLEDGADTIASAVWTIPSGISKDSQSEASGKTTVWLSGGTAGVIYPISVRMVTAGGRTYDRTRQLQVYNR